MNLLVSSPLTPRKTDFGFNAADYNSINEPPEPMPTGHEVVPPKLVVFEPTFNEFKTAPSEALGTLFTAPEKFNSDAFVLSIKYSQANARSFKGYLIDLSKYHKGRGYKGFTSTHVPWETYGVPMVGSSLFLIFSKQPMLWVPTKNVRYPRSYWSDLLYHSPTGRNMSGRTPGTAQMLGMLESSRAFLPNVESWKGPLPAEFREGTTVKVGTVGDQHLADIFGFTDHRGYETMALCTPVPLLKSLASLKAPETHGAVA